MTATPAGFDPMGEAFRSRDNAYGHLPDEQQPWYKAIKQQQPAAAGAGELMTSKAHELHVANIPANLTQDGLNNLFSKYGKVISVKLSRFKIKVSLFRWMTILFFSRVSSQRQPLRLRVLRDAPGGPDGAARAGQDGALQA